MSKCVNFFRRFFLVFLTCVVTVISMAVAISPPVSAAGVFSPFNFYQLYQMLHGLLLGDGGGNSQTFGEWLEKNMTCTIGSGNDKTTFLITPGMKLDDMMSEASIRLMLGAACTDGGAAGMLKIKHLMDSWTEVYDTSDIGEIGESGSADSQYFKLLSSGVQRFLFHNSSVKFSLDGSFKDYGTSGYGYDDGDFVFTNSLSDIPVYLYYCTSNSTFYCIAEVPTFVTISNAVICNKQGLTLNWRSLYEFSIGDIKYIFSSGFNSAASQMALNIFSVHGINIFKSDMNVNDFVKSNIYDATIVDSSDFIGPVYAMPAAKQLITDTGTLSGLRLDVQTEDGTPDISAALDHAGVESVDELVAGVAAGTIPMSQVYEDMRVVPYVLTDVETGEVVTDLNVSATDAKTKAVALDKDLSIPKDVSAVDAYQVTGKTWDPSLSKYKLPLFDFFPFCLPYDAYQFLTMLDVTPVAPVFQVDTTPLFSHTKFFHASDGYKITLDLTKYEEIFQILRAGECLAIVVGLCLISYKLIHGGD